MKKEGLQKRQTAAMAFIVIMGVVAMFSDMTHEGARSVLGDFLHLTGADGATIGFVSGVGELFGYSLRIASGYVADKTKKYWTLVLAGYGLQVLLFYLFWSESGLRRLHRVNRKWQLKMHLSIQTYSR